METTPSAVVRIKQLLEENETPDIAMLMFVWSGGCCGGMQYRLKPSELKERNYLHTDLGDGHILFMDNASHCMLIQATLDFDESGFKIKNPLFVPCKTESEDGEYSVVKYQKHEFKPKKKWKSFLPWKD